MRDKQYIRWLEDKILAPTPIRVVTNGTVFVHHEEGAVIGCAVYRLDDVRESLCPCGEFRVAWSGGRAAAACTAQSHVFLRGDPVCQCGQERAVISPP